MKFTAKQIADVIQGDVEGNPDQEVWKLSKIEEGEVGSICFLSNPKYVNYIYETQASVVIVKRSFVPERPLTLTLVKVEDPYRAFASILNYYQKFKNQEKTGIEQPSYVSEGVVYGDGFYLGAFSYLGMNVSVGRNVKIYPQVYIGDDVVIGDDVTIYSGAHIYKDVKIGSRCIINSGCVLAADGFGFVLDGENQYEKVPQLGTVILEDDVDLGACVTIDRATLGATTIKRGVKLDNQVHIAHNVFVDENTAIAAQVGVAGSTRIGKRCVIGGQAGIVGHLNIGDDNRIQAQSGVTKSTKQAATLQGTPAFEYSSYNKSYVYFRKLPSILQEIESHLKK